MKKPAVIASVAAMLVAPFLLLAYSYSNLPAELPMMRFPLADAPTFAAKSPFTVFRVPVMNLAHGAMAAFMLAHTDDFDNAAQRASYAALFSTLLFASAFKSNFEALEFSGFGHWAAAGTVLSMVGGIALALFRTRRARINWRQLRLATRDKIALLILFVLYLGIVAGSFLIGSRA